MADPEQIREAILAVLKRPSPALFVGAGVGRRVGLPDWRGFMEHLADACDRWNDKTSGELIRQRVGRNEYLRAGTVFKTSDLIPEGERWKEVVAPFSVTMTDALLERLEPLVDLPFSAIITTNYDNVLHKTCVYKRKWYVPVERGDGTLKGAVFQSEFFIGRLHGRVEDPTRMAFATEDYSELQKEADYLDFLLETFRSRTCLFVGFSFVDPAIDLVLRTYAAKYGPLYQALHCALLPSGATDLAARLRALNIEVVFYDPAEDHKDLWRGFRLAEQAHAVKPSVSALSGVPQESIRRFIAFAYAQVQLTKNERRSIAGVIHDGLVLSKLAGEPDRARTIQDLAAELSKDLRVSESEASEALVASVERLVIRDQILRDDDKVLLLKAPPLQLSQHLATLAANVADRVHVREGIQLSVADRAAVEEILERVLTARAWDVSAHFAGAGTGVGSDLRSVLKTLASELGLQGKLTAVDEVIKAVMDLLVYPEDRETVLLTQLGRAAFGLQLVLATPRQVLFQRFALPQRVYLDASVLMPAITSGHPLQPVYVEALKRLDEAARGVGLEMEVVVGEQFLNEIVSHRRNALDMLRELELDNPRKLDRHLAFHTASNTNVFIAGFGSHRKTRKDVSFASYLKEVAPYDTEETLSAFLATRLSIATKRMVFSGQHGGRFGQVFSDLLTGYESAQWYEAVFGKEKVLIQHEAQQLTQLHVDMDEGLRSVFVTADEKLRRILRRIEPLHAYSSAVISHVGLVALVDVMVGLEPDTRSWAKLVWNVAQTSDEESLVDYFVRVGVRRYQEGMALEMQDAARTVAFRALADARQQGISLFGERSLEQAKERVNFIERYEDQFFQNWDEAIKRRQEADR